MFSLLSSTWSSLTQSTNGNDSDSYSSSLDDDDDSDDAYEYDYDTSDYSDEDSAYGSAESILQETEKENESWVGRPYLVGMSPLFLSESLNRGVEGLRRDGEFLQSRVE